MVLRLTSSRIVINFYDTVGADNFVVYIEVVLFSEVQSAVGRSIFHSKNSVPCR